MMTKLKRSQSGLLKLSLWVVALVFIWCVALPRFAQLKPIRQHIDTMHANDINVGAMFYTELEWQPPPGAAWR